MENLLQYEQLISNAGLATMMMIIILYLIQSNKEREKFWLERFEDSSQEIKEKIDSTKQKVEINHELFSNNMKNIIDSNKETKTEIVSRIDELKKSISSKF